ncbi:MAG: hypothetical protein ACXV8N_19750 [Ilumatobacteraceae bacterium]
MTNSALMALILLAQRAMHPKNGNPDPRVDQAIRLTCEGVHQLFICGGGVLAGTGDAAW